MKLSKLPITLAIATMITLLTVSLVHAQNPIPLGTFYQPVPFEAIPGADAIVSVTAASRPSAFDGDLLTAGNAYPVGATTVASWTFQAYTAPLPENEFPIGWVDLKIKYQFPTATLDDTYRLRFSTDGGATWVDLTPAVSAAASKFNSDGAAQTRVFNKVAEPQDGIWEWTDLAALRIQVYWTRGATTWDGATRKIYISEIWADVYGQTTPAAGTSVAVQPPKVPAKETLDYATDYFFVDIVVREVTSFAGWQFTLDFDTNVLTPVDYITYYPMTDIAVADLNDLEGYVSLAMSIPITDPLVSTGLTGEQFSIARIFFTIDDSLTDPGVGTPNGTFSLLTLRPSPTTIIVDVTGAQIPYTGHNGLYEPAGIPEFPLGLTALMSVVALLPLAYVWRRTRSKKKVD